MRAIKRLRSPVPGGERKAVTSSKSDPRKQVPGLGYASGEGMDSTQQPALDCDFTAPSSEVSPMSSHLVSAFLSRNSWRYLEVQRAIYSLLEDFRASDKGRRFVHAVYSRADKQRGHESLWASLRPQPGNSG